MKTHRGGRHAPRSRKRAVRVERVQTGVRIEKRLLKVMKALADYHDITLGDLVESIVLHASEGKPVFGDESLRRIADLRRVFRLEIGAKMSHRMKEGPE